MHPAGSDSLESLTITYPSGTSHHIRLQDYESIFAIPGLYEEVVQKRLHCASPSRIAQGLLLTATQSNLKSNRLRVLDIGAGNGVSGEELRRIEVETLIGLDNLKMAYLAAGRDRPGTYDEYILADLSSPSLIPDLLHSYGLNAVTCSGSLGHLPVDNFIYNIWERFPKGTLLSAGVADTLEAENGLIALYAKTKLFEIISYERYLHRQAMDGSPIYNLALLARRT